MLHFINHTDDCLVACFTLRFVSSSVCFRSALRGWLLSAYDVRACAIEVVWRWLALVQPPGQPHQQQLAAMEALTIYCPLGHALGLGGCSAALEDAAFKVMRLYAMQYGLIYYWWKLMKLQGAEYAAGRVWHVHSSYGTTLAAIHRCLHGAATVLAQESAVCNRS